MKILKQVLGVDVAQKELVVTLAKMTDDLSIELYARKTFANKQTGFNALFKWVNKLTDDKIHVSYVMEPTGVYHEKFAFFLEDNNQKVSIVLPNKISNYLRTLDTKTVTDRTCADGIAQFGLERKLTIWKRPAITYKRMQQLTRERDQLVAERVIAKNQLHAENSEAEPNPNSIRRLKARIKFFNQQEREIKKDLETCLSEDQNAETIVKRLTTIPGIGRLTAQTILAETNGFELIKSKKQLSSYAGLDVIDKSSGTSIKTKPRISKKGNRHLRKSLHLPALTAIKRVDEYRELYARLVNKSGIKMKGVVAVQRKLLELTYILFKNDTDFEAGYEKKKREKLNQASPV